MIYYTYFFLQGTADDKDEGELSVSICNWAISVTICHFLGSYLVISLPLPDLLVAMGIGYEYGLAQVPTPGLRSVKLL